MGDYRLVDLPGYGYAKVSRTKKMELSDMIVDYLKERQNLKIVFQVCDANIITALEMSDFLKNIFHENHFVVLNKIDKESKSFFYNNKHKFTNYLELDIEKFIPVSATKKTNISEIYNVIKNNIG